MCYAQEVCGVAASVERNRHHLLTPCSENAFAAGQLVLCDSCCGLIACCVYSSGSVPLPADLFSGLESLTVEPPTASQPGLAASTANDPVSPSQSNTAAAAAVKPAPVLSGPSIPSEQPTSTRQTATQLPPHVHNASTSQVTMPAPAPVVALVGAPESRRKKKTTRRVGYARDQAEDSPAERTASGSSSLASTPLATAALLSTHHAPVAAQPLSSGSAAPTAATSAPPSALASAVDAQQRGKPATTSSTGSLTHSLPEQAPPAQPASPVNASASQGLPAAGSPKRQHKAAVPQAPPTLVQLASLSLPEAVAAASLATPAQVVLPAALTAETLLQV